MTKRGARKRDPFSDGINILIALGTFAMMAYLLVPPAVRSISTALGPVGTRAVAAGAALTAASWVALRVRRRMRSRRLEHELALWQAEQDRHVHTADEMSGIEFEHLVARLLRRDGLVCVRVAGGANDRGADVFAETAEGCKVVVQCKRYQAARAVTSPEMQLFVGMAWREHHADIPLYVTTGRYTREARDIAARHGILLIGRTELGRWMAGGTAFGTALTQAPR